MCIFTYNGRHPVADLPSFSAELRRSLKNGVTAECNSTESANDSK